ncbi:MAG: site-specific integrase [Nanoarchaeota archaeon]|nr:site-specific integrase [Nanoarchaeota archaeon]
MAHQRKHEGSLAISERDLSKIIASAFSRKTKRKSQFSLFINIRNAVMIMISWYMGLRSIACYNAKLSYLNLDDRTFYIPAGSSKTGEQMISVIPRCIVPRIRDYLKVREKFFPNSEWLFPSRNYKNRDSHMDKNSYIYMFRDAVKRAGLYRVNFIDKAGHSRSSITSHGLRKGGATEVYDVTGDVIKVKNFLGHTDSRMRSTWRYIDASREKVCNRVADEVFDKIWTDESKTNQLMARLTTLLELSQNKKVPMVQFVNTPTSAPVSAPQCL